MCCYIMIYEEVKKMRKWLLGFVLVFLLSCCLPAANQGVKAEDNDFSRAFLLDLAGPEWEEKAGDQISSSEYRGLLLHLVGQVASASTEWFEQKVTNADEPLERDIATVMSWYAAVAIGADGYNYTEFDHTRADGGDFWQIDGGKLQRLMPDALDNSQPVVVDEEHGMVWNNEYTAALLWNIWHKSPVSELQVIAFDETAGSMRNHDPFTVREALEALTRLYDSMDLVRYAALDSPEVEVLSIDASVLAKAQATEIRTMDDLPRLTGFRIDTGFMTGTSTQFGRSVTRTAEDIRNVAGWGFNSVLLFFNYETFFTEDCTQVNLTELQKLDRLVEEAIRDDIHVCLLFYNLPGRTAWFDEQFGSGGDFDMFINPQKREMSKNLWRVFARHFRSVPGAYLSFEPFHESENKALSTGKEAPDYTAQDISHALEEIILAIRQEDPGRFIIYEANSSCGWEHVYENIIRDNPCHTMAEKYENTRISYNFVEMPFVYAEMTATQGEHIDFNNHSLFKPEYPVTIYSVRKRLDEKYPLTITGYLPKGTKIDLYLAHTEGNGSFRIETERGKIFEEKCAAHDYETSYLLSWKYPYATSDRLISFTLEEDTDNIFVKCEKCSIEWCGLDVTLPDEDAVERWYSYTQYDAFVNGEPEAAGPHLVKTSRIMICPDDKRPDAGTCITIHRDVTFTTEKILEESNAETMDKWGAQISEFTPRAVIRYESGYFNAGTTQDSLLRYYDDMLGMFDKYGFDWYSNDYDLILRNSPYVLHDARTVVHGGYREFNMEILEMMQKHLSREHSEKQ